MSAEINAADYLLGELGPEARAEAERRLREDEGFRLEVERLRPVVSRLGALPGEAWAPPAPPPLHMPPEPSDAAAGRPRWLRPALVVAAACALVGIGVGAGVIIGSDDAGPADPADERPTLALRPLVGQPASAGGTARVVGRAGDHLRLDVHGLAPTGSGRFYELWLMDEDGKNLVALAGFRVPASGAATVEVPLAADPTRFQYLDLSLEPNDGDPGHSGDSILRGAT